MNRGDFSQHVQKYVMPLLVFIAGFVFVYAPSWETGLGASLAVIALLLVVRFLATLWAPKPSHASLDITPQEKQP